MSQTSQQSDEATGSGSSRGGSGSISFRKKFARMMSSDGKTKGDREREQQQLTSAKKDVESKVESSEPERGDSATSAEQKQGKKTYASITAAEDTDNVVIEPPPPKKDSKKLKSDAEKEAQEFAKAADDQAKAVTTTKSLRERAREAREQAKSLGEKASQILSKHKRQASSGQLDEDAPLNKLAKNETGDVGSGSSRNLGTESSAAVMTPTWMPSPNTCEAAEKKKNTAGGGGVLGLLLMAIAGAGIAIGGAIVLALDAKNEDNKKKGEKPKKRGVFGK